MPETWCQARKEPERNVLTPQLSLLQVTLKSESLRCKPDRELGEAFPGISLLQHGAHGDQVENTQLDRQ
jgi:hypothetical protein